MNRCKECGIEIDDYQAEKYNQVCSDCTRIIKASDRYKFMQDWLTSRNMFEASLIILSISCFILGILFYLLFHPLLIILSIVGVIAYAIAFLHNRETRKIRDKLRDLKALAEI